MPAEDPPRASPEALLATAERAGRGKLRIFLGAAPGVGKTFAMLQAARAAKAGGRDVVVGLIETHGRAETEALIAGLEVLPRTYVPHRGRLVPEFDLDAALARRPALMLVDEYAHSNVLSSRHPKRWQDVQDLVAAGIDVWTTLNVQHVESLNDVVQRITGIRVRETVPDTTLEKADEIILVDLPPDELLKRLADGKVYVEDTAAQATKRFFRPGNLTALRELALRRTAARVDSDLLERMQGGAIDGPWPAGERLLACIGPDANAERVVRETKRLADLMDAPWHVVTVERPGLGLTEADRARLDAAMRLAETLGAQTRALIAPDLPAEIVRFARFENVTQIVIGRGRRRWTGLRRRSLADALVPVADGISVHIVTGAERERAPLGSRLPPAGPWPGYALAALCVAVATVLGQALTHVVSLPNVSMLYLLAVLVPAITSGFWPAVAGSVLSFVAYNFFFIDPVYTLTIARPHELLALAIFLVIAVLISAIAGRAREQSKAAAQRMRATRRLYDFTRRLSALPGIPAVTEAAVAEVFEGTGRGAVLLLADDDGDLALAAAWPPDDALDAGALSAARWAQAHGEPAGAGTGTLPAVPWRFLPLAVAERRAGVLGVACSAKTGPPDPETAALMEALAEQTAAAVVRARLSGEVAHARTAAETERVRNILLASISHDFRTPLSSILGAVTSLIDYGAQIAEPERRDLLQQVREESEHLDSMVRNLLAITRLESGALDLRQDWVDVEEVLNRAAALARKRGARQSLSVTVAPGLPLAFADQTLLDQAIGNVVGNAVRYTPADGQIRLAARADAGGIEISVTDTGPGLAPGMAEQIFEKFVRGGHEGGDGGEGAGLGLAITRGIVEAHGGTARAESPPPGAPHGTRILLTLPLKERSEP